MWRRILPVCALFATLIWGCNKDEASNATLQLVRAFVGTEQIDLAANSSEGMPVDRSISLVFSHPLDKTSAGNAIALLNDGQPVNADVSVLTDGKTIAIYPEGVLLSNTVYTVAISGSLRGVAGESFVAREFRFKTAVGALTLTAALIEDKDVIVSDRITEVPFDLSLILEFSSSVDPGSLEDASELTGPGAPPLNFSWSDNNRTVKITTTTSLGHLSKYQFKLSQLVVGALGEPFSGFSRVLYTKVDPTPKQPVVSDDALLTMVQQQTFKYFWDFAHQASGMARERNTSGDIVTSGGSGFGIMAIIVGIERSFITRQQGLERMDRILTFLESADRFHGAWPHWMNGNTGDVVPFSANDNGGDLVETSFLIQGLLTFRQYLDPNVTGESALIDRINNLWETVEWNWYTQGGQNVLFWHWSPDKQWVMNHRIRGYNEALITYFLAAASPTHSIDASVYHEGWADNGAIRNNKSFYGITLPLGYDYGGPLFFAHYSFLGLDPRNLQDEYANYWTQNVNHTLINRAYSADNPKNFVGYSADNWGLTASDNHQGYSAHSPTNDLGVITPTAALSSFPYTPEESMEALKFFYYTLGDRLWGPYGFYDAFNVTEGWTADSYLAIDQGPIIVMIENYRTGLLWDLFMSSSEIQVAKNKLGFAE